MANCSLKLQQGSQLVAPFIYDALQARLAEHVGHRAIYMTGFGTAARIGLPDVGLITFSEMLENLRIITSATEIPVITDADTGYGNPLNVARTIREFESTGVAALHLEDQQWPKRCGYMQGKSVISVDHMRQKLRAALDSRRGEMLIIGRTDALQSLGWDGAEERARAYLEEGVDAVFVDGVGIDDIEEYSRRLGDMPLLFNNVSQAKNESFAHCDFQIVLDPGPFIAAVLATRRAMQEMLTGTGDVSVPEPNDSFELLLDVLDAESYFKLGSMYDDGAQV